MQGFSSSFLIFFYQIALGGMFALAGTPFHEIERGFYKSTAGVLYFIALLAHALYDFPSHISAVMPSPSSTKFMRLCRVPSSAMFQMSRLSIEVKSFCQLGVRVNLVRQG